MSYSVLSFCTVYAKLTFFAFNALVKSVFFLSFCVIALIYKLQFLIFRANEFIIFFIILKITSVESILKCRIKT